MLSFGLFSPLHYGIKQKRLCPLAGDDAANKAMFRGLLKQISEDNLVSGDSNTRLIMFIATLSWRGDQLEESLNVQCTYFGLFCDWTIEEK